MSAYEEAATAAQTGVVPPGYNRLKRMPGVMKVPSPHGTVWILSTKRNANVELTVPG